VARAARLSLILLVAVLAGCGGSSGGKAKASKRCPTQGRDVTFPLLDPKQPHTVDVLTNYGRFAFRLDVEDSPCVTSSFASLVRQRYFDGTIFHRIVPGFVIQGGDRTGTGAGGPGYTVVDVPPKNSLYTEGVVAMAKSSAEPRGAAGSQFFIVTAPDAGLPPDYAILGVVTKGVKVVERIGRLGNRTTERPTRRVVVLRMTLV
jgi:peptidylprolyl isomerase/peptidyl-prolyl cis-trans isomerase B (cyclophilin B)